MGNRALENRIKKLMGLEEQIKILQQEAGRIKEEIKADMESKGQQELQISNYVVRYKTISSSKFDTTAFKAEHSKLYEQYVKRTEGKRFSVAC